MTDQEIKDALLDWVKVYCNNTFEDDDGNEVLPGGVTLFLNSGVAYTKAQTGIQSESLGKYSVTLTTDFPESMMRLLHPYRKLYKKTDWSKYSLSWWWC